MKLCLVVDDSGVIRKVARTLLNSLGYEVVEADCGASGLAACDERMPDAIMIDWDLPDMSGFDFLIDFKKRFPRATPHIVYATTEQDPLDISRALQNGAADYMLVPFDRMSVEDKFPYAAAVG